MLLRAPLLLLVLAVALPARAAAASFAPPQTIGTSGRDQVKEIRIGLLPSGAAVVGYVDDDLVREARAVVAIRAPGAPFGPARVLASGDRAGLGDVAAAPGASSGVLTWSDGRTLSAARVGASGRIGPPRAVAPGNVARVLIDARGDAAIATHWYFSHEQPFVGTWRRDDARPEPPRRLAGAWPGWRIVGLETGFAAIWTERATGCPRSRARCPAWVVRAAISRDGGAFGRPWTIGATGERGELRLLARPDDGALAVWSTGGGRIRAAVLAPGATRFGPQREISAPARRGRRPEAALDRRGAGLVVWEERAAAGAPGRVVAVPIDRRGRIGDARALSPRAADARAPRVRVNDRGDALVSWSNGRRWWVRTRRAGGERFTPAYEMPARSRLPRLQLTRTGDAIAVSSGEQVTAAAWSAGTRPVPQQLGVDHGIAGGGVTLSVNAHGAAIATWTGPTGVQAAIRRPGGAFEPPATLAPERAWRIWSALNDRGDALVAWYHPDGGDYLVRAALGTLP